MTDSKTTTTPATAKGPSTWQENQTDAGNGKKQTVPEGLWMRCPSCEAMLYKKAVEQNLHVCPECEHHYRIHAEQRIDQYMLAV